MLKTAVSRIVELLMTISLLGGAALAQDSSAQDLSTDWALGHWEGEIQVPGSTLTVKVDLEKAGEGWKGTIDIPQQGAKGLGLANVEVAGDSVSFVIDGVPGTPTFDGKLVDQRIEGNFIQGSANLTFWLGREEVAGPARPQEPMAPFPYSAEEVSYKNGEVVLAGTLTLPEGDGPFPAALLITGSGPQDRDEALAGHRPFFVLADHLTRAGIAVLRVDDRGIGGSTGGPTMDATSAVFAGDVVAGVEFLRDNERIREVGVIGHSEGGVVGPMAAVLTDEIAFVVMMAGTGVPGSEILVEQLELITRANGADDATIQSALALQKRALELIGGEGPREERAKLLRKVVEEQLAATPTTAGLEGEAKENAIQQAVDGSLNPWFEAFVGLDPRVALRQVKVPVLALNGNLDLQVDADQNLPEIARALVEGGNQDVSLRRFPKLNHLFQTATTGSPNEYALIEETIAPVVLEVMTDWILDRFGSPEN